MIGMFFFLVLFFMMFLSFPFSVFWGFDLLSFLFFHEYFVAFLCFFLVGVVVVFWFDDFDDWVQSYFFLVVVQQEVVDFVLVD